MSAVNEWLRSLGLERYEQAFAEHDVDEEVLRDLTPQDLIEIGVASIGHRRRLLNAIAALTPATLAVAAPAHEQGTGAERRLLTVLYCDMVGSTALSARLDPEDMREVLRGYHQTCTRLVTRYGGHIANFIGDGLLVYFGWPQAHEDDAQRAVRAGLALMGAVGALATPGGEALAARVGVATGPVVVGDLIHEGPAQEQSAVGETPNLAARLLALAGAGEVVVDEPTRRLLGAAFEAESLGQPALKGIDEPPEVFRVRAELFTVDRFKARAGLSPPPLVGREAELAALMDHWARSASGQGRGLLLVGDAGLGKSRLCRAMIDEIKTQPHYRIRLQCSQHHTDSPLWPVAQHLMHATGVHDGATKTESLDRLDALVEHDRATASVLAPLLELDAAARYGELDLTAPQQRARTLQVLVEQPLRLAARQPVVLVVEDAQWVDPTTLELLTMCMRSAADAKFMVMLTSRPENEPRLDASLSPSRLVLKRLDAQAIQSIVVRIAGSSLDGQTVAALVDQTDGVPLSAEELTRATLETGGTAIPASLHGSLMARLDRIPEAKGIVQAAACIGREFDVGLLAAVTEWPRAELARAIERLAAAELIMQRNDRPRDVYSFRHALLQEAAYESLLRARRRELHARILAALEAASAQAPHELLARHAARAGQLEKAVDQWGLAGRDALAKSAYVEAANHLGHAIELIHVSHDAAVDWRSRELRLQIALGQARMATLGYGAQATRQSFERARELLEVTQETALRIPVVYGLWIAYIMAVGTPQAIRMAVDLLAAGEADADEQTQLVAHRLAGSGYLACGRWALARSHFERAVAIHDRDPARFGNLAAQYGMEPGAAACSSLAVVMHVAGFAEQGAALAARARALAGNVRHANARAPVYCDCVNLAILQRDTERMARDVEVFTQIALENGLPVWSAYASGMSAWRSLEDGRANEAIAGFRRCLAGLIACGERMRNGLYQLGLALALSQCGLHDEAAQVIDDALQESAPTQHTWLDAELWRVRAGLAWRRGSGDAHVRSLFERALSIARMQGARTWELRAALDAARHECARQRQDKARELLAPVFATFAEGFETADLRDARDLLSSLAPPP
jgi:class 3 adenylate cyclase/tetratricopeptide (TPR) repeat protein